MNFYKNVFEYKGKLLVRGIRKGEEYQEKVNFSPTLFTITNEKTKHKTLTGLNLRPIEFDSIPRAREFKKQYDTDSSPLYGMERYQYQYIANEYRNEIEYSKEFIKIYTIDIETSCEEGFPDVENPIEEILCLTVKNQTNKQIITWGIGEYKHDMFHKHNYHHTLLEFLVVLFFLQLPSRLYLREHLLFCL